MRRYPRFLLGGAVGLSLMGVGATPSAPGALYSDARTGFTLRAPRFPRPASGTSAMLLVLSAPPENGFASNVNVMVQQVGMTRKAYRDLSVRQFEAAGNRLHSEKSVTVSGKEALLFDYESTLQGRELRHLALAVVERHRVMLVTCTALRTNFKKHEPEFRACLKSFKLP